MIKYLLFLLLPFGAYAQECPSISSICEDYEDFEYVLVGKGDTTAVVSKANVPKDLSLVKTEDSWENDNGTFTMYYHQCLRIIYAEFFDGRTGTTISRL